MNTSNSTFYLPNQTEYAKTFWDYACGQEGCEGLLEAGRRSSGSYVLPSASDAKFSEALKRESLFRTIGTYVYSRNGSSRILAKHSDDTATWVPDGEAIPVYDGIHDFSEITMDDHTLASILKMVGADQVINPEAESGMRVARALASPTILDLFDVGENLCMIEMVPDRKWIGKTLLELNLRQKRGINVIAMKEPGTSWSYLDAHSPIKDNATLLVVLEKKLLSQY